MVHFSIVVLFKAATLCIGALITYYSLKAYRRTDATQLRALAIGFGVVTLGVLAAGVLDQLIPSVPRRTAMILESLFTTVGFAVILYSLFAE